MSTHLQDKVEKIEQIITKISEESSKGKLILVEGKKDLQTLRELGVCGSIITIKTGGKSFLEVTTDIEQLAPVEVILLLDFDRRGIEGTKRIQHNLERARIKVNTVFWRDLLALTGREIHCVESLLSYLMNLHMKIKT